MTTSASSASGNDLGMPAWCRWPTMIIAVDEVSWRKPSENETDLDHRRTGGAKRRKKTAAGCRGHSADWPQTFASWWPSSAWLAAFAV